MKTVRRRLLWWLLLALFVLGVMMALRPADSAQQPLSLNSPVSFPVDI